VTLRWQGSEREQPRLGLPLPYDLAALSHEERTACIQTSTRQIVQADGNRSAIRVILPIPLDTGDLVRLGVWLALDGAEWDRVLDAAKAGGTAWSGTAFTGRLLNAVEPWPIVYLADATAIAPGPNKVARVTGSTNELLGRVIAGPGRCDDDTFAGLENFQRGWRCRRPTP
jgi:hypothetical protein